MPDLMSFAAKIQDVDIGALPHVPALDELRPLLLKQALDLGVPTRRIEAWHYTDLARLLDKHQEALSSNAGPQPHLNMPHLRFSDGEMSWVEGASGDVASIFDFTAKLQSKAEEDASEAMLAFNIALLAGGLRLTVAPNTQQELCVVYEGAGLQHLRHDIHVASGATLTLVEVYNGSGYSNVASDISIDEGGCVNHIKVHSSGQAVTLTRPDIQQSGVYTARNIVVGGQLARHETRALLAGTGARADLSAALIACTGAHHDVTSVITHAIEDTTSETQIRSLVDAGARAVFQGKVVVARDAQRVDAQQQSRALLLAPDAEMNVKPELEIYADDVACAHGSTVGALDSDALFFLRSRGIPENVARQMLVLGFLADITDKLPAGAIADFVASHIEANLDFILQQPKGGN